MLKKNLGFFTLLSYGIGTMVGAGIFTLSSIAASNTGPAVIFSFMISGIVAILTAFSYAELSAAFPKAGGGYVYLKEVGGEFIGFIGGWMLWFGYVIACSVYALAFAEYFLILFPSLFSKVVIAFIIVIILAKINSSGSLGTGRTQSVLTYTILAILAVFILKGIFHINFINFSNFAPEGLVSIFSSAGLLFITFLGFELISQASEETENPEKDIPRVTMISILVVMFFYILISLILTGVLNYQTFGSTGMYKAASVIFGPLVGIISVTALLSTSSSLNGSIMAASRVVFAMARDGLLPRKLSKLNKERVPGLAILLTALAIAAMINLPTLEIIAYATATLFLLVFILVNIAAVALRYLKDDIGRPFEIPLFPITPIAALLASVAMLFFMSIEGFLISAGIIVIGTIIYFIHIRKRIEREIEDVLGILRKIHEDDAGDEESANP